MPSALLEDPQVKKALEPLALAAPNGWKSIATLDDDKLFRILTHPDLVRVVWPTRYIVELPKVDEKGFAVLDHTFTQSHRIVVDPADPDVDLSRPILRQMRFGGSILDMNFMLQRKHGDFFYIAYSSGVNLPRTILCVVLDPTIV